MHTDVVLVRCSWQCNVNFLCGESLRITCIESQAPISYILSWKLFVSFVVCCLASRLGDVDEVLPADAVFEGLGFGEEVPSYLRYEGTIRNIRISRRTTIDLVHEICAAKAAHEALGVNAVSVVLPAARRQNSSTVNGRDSDSDLESVDTRPRSSMLRSPPLSPVSPRTQALFGSMRPFSGGGAEEPGGAAAGAVLSVQADAGGALPALSSIDSRAELSVMSLSTLPSTCSMAEFFECFLRVSSHCPKHLMMHPCCCFFLYERTERTLCYLL